METPEQQTWAKVRERYTEAARSRPADSCCGTNYAAAELAVVPPESALGLGSGQPVRHADLRPGEVVVDLGSGAGIDCFLAARAVGSSGRVIGIDMTPAMLERARAGARRAGFENVEFREAHIEHLPLPDAAVDIVLSNCVINLSPDKAAVFREAHRVLRPGGRLVVADIVQERPLPPEEDGCGCVATAMVRADYLETIRAAGFDELEVVEDRPWRASGQAVDASAITIQAIKPKEVKR